MSIAQRFVAGEGEAHPEDSAALSAFRCDSTNLPWVIFRAAFRAAHIEQIPPRARAVLSALARTVDAAKPFAAIFARRDLLTGRALQSMRTFYRSLDDLEVAGLIERRPQSRYVEAGLFGRAYLHLTEHAAALLGLVDASRTRESKASQAPSSSTAAPSQSSFPAPSATLADGGIYKDLSPSVFQKRQPGQLPSDLLRLRTLGFFDFLIFKLMREARDQGKRLSDVVEATWEHLKLAKAPISYLRTLLRTPVDFTRLLRRRNAEGDTKQARAQQCAEGQAIARQHAGRTFTDADNERQFVVGAGGDSLTIFSLTERVGRQAAGWMQSFAAALKSGKLRPATALDLERFAHAQQQALGNAQPSAGPLSMVKSPVTGAVRDHIAGLRQLLKLRSAGA
ncbi:MULTISPECIES: Replication protein O [unclassified Caballeronia]|uniref:Replication protein O n=1 Tax=unclassified Caballeronia TaxID=2646786 RepID=UPI0028675673|nr:MULTISPECIES: Replication protein O [unclassified Caballeronia]MDR5776859.1 Replication protein O [Caballeronia sp. LZ002]MDR5798835.1 Replication protein O [Caballeronia sp. LZ001]MDR5852356.1 Replication protein O [Caballeronia sp. LZ003]